MPLYEDVDNLPKKQMVSTIEEVEPDPNDYVGAQEFNKAVEEVHKEPEEEIKPAKKAPYAKKQIDDRYQSIYLPSKFAFYDFKALMVRKFEIRDLSKMFNAVQSGSYDAFKDVIQGCIDVDINDLTPGDFKYLCYWLRTNSYTRTPIRIEWTSRYGNKCISEVTKDTITTLEMDATPEQLKPWLDKGFTAPTMRFASIFQDENLSEGDDYMYSNAQYFKGNTWDEKIANMEKFLNENGLEALNDVAEWDKLIDHGVEEKFKVFDLNFNPEEYKKKLEEKVKKAKILKNNLDKNDDDYLLVSSTLVALQNELDNLKAKLKKGEEIRPEAEEIFLEMGPDELLSPILPKGNNQ